MVGLSFRKLSKLVQWGKIFLPLQHIRYFPPRFILRDPVVEGVYRAYKSGHEVAIIVYNIKNMSDLTEKFGKNGMEKAIHKMRKVFREVIKRELRKDDIILLDYHYSEGITLYIQMDHEQQSVSDIDVIMNKIYKETEKALPLEIAEIQPVFDKGYMFIEKKHYTVQEAIFQARQQALSMAEKRVQTEYNEMIYEMSKIIAKKDIRLLGQPIMNIDTREIHGWEMLTRGPEKTNLEMPLRLFSVARQTGHLYDLEMIVLEKMFEKVKETGCKQDIFVNFTPLTLGNKRFVPEIKQLLDTFTMIDPHKIIMEMTEQDSVDVKKDLLENIKMLRMLGFRFALDDTGAGYSSFHTIGEILPEIIKIDRAVIQNIHQNSVNESMLKGILIVAKEVGSRVVAEGIENEEEANVLSRHEVDFVQGFYFARPSVFNKHLLASL